MKYKKPMKLYICHREGSYSGGLAIVAANSPEEAFEVFHKDSNFDWMLDSFDEDGNYTEDITKVDSYYYQRANWRELPNVVANIDTPQVLAEGGYTE